MVQRDSQGRRLCGAKKKRGGVCKAFAVKGAMRCRMHLGNRIARANAVVRAEVSDWVMGEQTDDPGEVLLRLVTQSARRVQRYSRLLEQAYEAAERLRSALEHNDLLIKPEPELQHDDEGEPIDGSDFEHPAAQAAREDLERIFNHGGVAALVGNVYTSTPSGAVFATGEAIRGLAKLEADERDRCAGFAAKAVAAGLAERQVRLAERQGAMLEMVLSGVLAKLGLSDEQIDQVPDLIEAELALVAG